MAVWNTGPIENNAVNGSRPTVSTTVKLTNQSTTQAVVVLTQGYNLTGTRELYIISQDEILPNTVMSKDYYSNLDSFEFVFNVTGGAVEDTEISVWGKGSSGQLTTPHRLVSAELVGSYGAAGVTGRPGQRAQQESQERRVQREQQEQPERRAQLELRELLAGLVRRGLREQRVSPEWPV